ncbi:MAG: LPXTG cell wall anchor domain-containing protein, partial [Acidimicrobiales bacterium]
GSTWAMADIDPGPIEMAVSDLGFVGVSANRVLFSANGTSWSEYPVEMAFHDVAAAGNTLVALAPDGIYTWTARPASLPDTGTDTTTALKIGAGLIAIGAAVLAIRSSVAPSR